MARRRADELLAARELELHGPAEPQGRERDDVLREHLLLAAEPAAHALAVHAHALRVEVEDARQVAAREERHLRGRPHDEPPVVVERRDGAVRLERRVLHAVGAVRGLVHDVGLREPALDVAELAVHLGDDVRLRPRDTRGGGVELGVHERGAGRHGRFRVDDGGQRLVLDADPAHALLSGGDDGLGDDGRDPLADVPHHVVEDPRVVGVVGEQLVLRGREPGRGRVLVREHGVHAGHRERLRRVDRDHARVRVRGPHELEVEQARVVRRVHVERVPHRPGDDPRPAGAGTSRPNARPAERAA